jgi:hypothetical protein
MGGIKRTMSLKSLARFFISKKTITELEQTGNDGSFSISDNPDPSYSVDGLTPPPESFQEDTATDLGDADQGALPEDYPPNCALLYCERHHLGTERFVSSMFWKTLYPRTKFFCFPIILLVPRAFSADREFIAQVGQVETMEQYREIEDGFHRWPGCRSFLRGTLCLRVSTRRVRRLVESLLLSSS